MSMDCLPLNSLDLENWSARLTAPLKGKRFPLSATFELTNRCNMRCVHCFINEPQASRAAISKELSTAQVCDLLDRIAAAGCLFLTLTGGEVFLRSDFEEIYTHALQNGMVVVLFTNGTLITESTARLLAEYRPLMVEITLYGATAEVYENMTRIPGSYERCMRGIHLLLEQGIPLRLKSELTTINASEILAMKSLTEALGLEFRYDGLLWPRLDGDKRPLQYQLPMETLLSLDQVDTRREDEEIGEVERLKDISARTENIYSCGAGHNNFHIDSAGRMSICMMSRRPSFDLLRMSVEEAWHQIGLLKEQKRVLPSNCISCTINQLCSQCPGWSQAFYGDNATVVPFVCELGMRRSSRAIEAKRERLRSGNDG